MAIWSPQPGPQVDAAICPCDFTFYGGTRGSGKSDCLLGRQVRGAEKWGNWWNGLIIRRRYKEFAELRRRVDELIAKGLPAVRVGGDQQTNYIRFQGGAQVAMVAAERLEKIDDFLGHQYCVAENTPIIMGDRSLRKIQDIRPGDFVMTLEGPKEVLRCMSPRESYCVEAVTPFGTQIHPINHPIFSISGWTSYASILDEHSITIEEILPGVLPPPVASVFSILYKPPLRQLKHSVKTPTRSRATYKYDSQCLERLEDLLLSHSDRPLLSERPRRLLDCATSKLSYDDIACVLLGFRTAPGSQACCFLNRCLRDAQLQVPKETAQDDIPPQAGAASPSLLDYMQDVLGNIQEYNPVGVSQYGHPYTGQVRKATEDNAFFPCALSFHGQAKVYDLTVKDANHYITGSSFLVNKNTEISIDECQTFPFFLKMIDKLSGSNRSPHGVPSRMFGTGNPGGPGHNDVKLHFKLGREFGVKPGTVIYNDLGESRVYIPGMLKDNHVLYKNDPKYVKKLMSIRDPMLRRAWLEGDWDVYIGQAFLISEEHHIVKPMPVPDAAPIYMTFDWGYSAPFSIGWWWIDADGRFYRFAEWYGYDEIENEGLRMVDSEIAKGIKKREMDMGIWDRPIKRLCDPTCQNKKPDYKGGGQGPSTIEEFTREGIYMRPGDPNRKLKIRQFRERISIPTDSTERPMLQVYSTCRQFIRTIPSLCMDETNPEDIDTEQNDHIYDEACHICMARPMKLVEVKEEEKPKVDSATAAAQKEYAIIIEQMQVEQELDDWNRERLEV